MAKESGHEEFPSTSMCFKRCYDRDISFGGEQIYSFDLQSVELVG